MHPGERSVCRQRAQSVGDADHAQSVRHAQARGRGQQGEAPGSVDENLVHRLGVGEPLGIDARGFFEQRLRVNLSRVQLHANPGAAREAEKLSAKAFTIGNHIAFAAGEFQPNTPEGQELIAHELAHVAQQQGGAGEAIIMRWPAVTRTAARTSETPATIRALSL